MTVQQDHIRFRSLLTSVLAVVFIGQSAFAASHVGSRGSSCGGTDCGGGGTFIKGDHSSRLVLWDLYESNPQIQDSQKGDKLTLSEAGREARGEWIDERKLKSFKYLEGRLALWKRRAPLFAAQVRFEMERFPLFIATPLGLSTVRELANISAPLSSDVKFALPAAAFDYSSGLYFVNDQIWNKAGILSQAALLLHEHLREIQRRTDLTNDELQKIVAEIILFRPDHVQSFNDARFGNHWATSRPTNQPELVYLEDASRAGKPAKPEVADAFAKKLLSDEIGEQTVRSGEIESEGFRSRIPDAGGEVLLEPASCLGDLTKLSSKSHSRDDDEESFECDIDGASGSGSLLLLSTKKRDFWVDLGVSHLTDRTFKVVLNSAKKPAAFAVLDLSFDGSDLRLGFAGEKSGDRVVKFDSSQSSVLRVQVLGSEHKLRLFKQSIGGNASEVLAEWALPSGMSGSKTELSFVTGDSVRLEFVRVSER